MMTNDPFRYRKRRKSEIVTEEKKKVSTKITGNEYRALSLGWDIAIPIFAGPLIGLWIDRRTGSAGTYSLIFLGVGILLSAVQICRYIYRESIWTREEEKRNKE